MHFIVPFYYSRDYVKKGLQKVLKKYGFTSAILSIIGMFKMNCITMEKYEEHYKTNEESAKRTDLSLGEDLESFIGKIKDGKINHYTIPENGDQNFYFLLCLLDKEERKKLEQRDETFLETFEWDMVGGEADVLEAEWKASASDMKFSKSLCWRATYFIEA